MASRRERRRRRSERPTPSCAAGLRRPNAGRRRRPHFGCSISFILIAAAFLDSCSKPAVPLSAKSRRLRPPRRPPLRPPDGAAPGFKFLWRKTAARRSTKRCRRGGAGGPSFGRGRTVDGWRQSGGFAPMFVVHETVASRSEAVVRLSELRSCCAHASGARHVFRHSGCEALSSIWVLNPLERSAAEGPQDQLRTRRQWRAVDPPLKENGRPGPTAVKSIRLVLARRVS